MHNRLDHHFRTLHEHRQALQPTAPVFALEHDLSGVDFELLLVAVRDAIAQGLSARNRVWWLPFVVYAAEIGYNYVGGEYWPLFSQETPGWESKQGWNVSNNRNRIKQWFEEFSVGYGGAKPKGSFAANFSIIAWPITHAVMPTYLQRQLAQLLFESRTVLTSELLRDPSSLGACLASRTGRYSERFQIFCANQGLLGQVAAALLSGDDEECPYLVRSTLDRLVEGLSSEQQSRTWLSRAKHSADLVRSRGFRPPKSDPSFRQPINRLPNATDPKLLLQRDSDGWRPYLELPDLTPLQNRQKQVIQELRSLRPSVEGNRGPLPRGKLMYPDKVPLYAWPRNEVPLIQLEHGTEAINRLIADHCAISRGPWWLFRKQAGGPAVEVKNKTMRPGYQYCLVGRLESDSLSLPWSTKTTILAEGVCGFEITVPQIVGDTDIARLASAGLAVVSDVSIGPVGLVPGAWDGEGAVEWLAGEPAMLLIRSTRAAHRCVISVDHDVPVVLDWPAYNSELLFAIEGLSVGTHEVGVTLLPADMSESLASGSLILTIRDPHVTSIEATEGSGIRLFTSPARPKLSELLDGRISISIDGPLHTRAELTIVLRDHAGGELARRRQAVSLPFNHDAWKTFSNQHLRKSNSFYSYGEAESCEISVKRNGVQFASLICERGFLPLRWVLIKRRNGEYEARLIDRTDADTRVHLYRVETPTISEECDPRRPIAFPDSGGMLEARSGNATAAIILPPEPNQLRQNANDHPLVECAGQSLSEVLELIYAHHRWQNADRSPDPFADRQRERVLDAITTALVSLVAGNRWARLERKRLPLINSKQPDMLDEMQRLVGDSPMQRAVAKQIATHLWRWADSATALREGFSNAIASLAAVNGIGNVQYAAELLLLLAREPGCLANWNSTERDTLLNSVLHSPALIRAARFAVLGTEDLRDKSNIDVIGETWRT
ncbi:hypothetical protein MTP10_13570 [Nonomuraea sp. 3-1Str]|uniref:hypothetical protein n=1 Tax=Nonomuraea sp. 3-1Str TaxID=2929801 RepID=UPI002860E543|nr:hypothetical protein [Nonomuraea sp. 3-1Str]MDR8409765.1 hypothetical protein [Nonomuraea sp. 3-1Str]